MRGAEDTSVSNAIHNPGVGATRKRDTNSTIPGAFRSLIPLSREKYARITSDRNPAVDKRQVRKCLFIGCCTRLMDNRYF